MNGNETKRKYDDAGERIKTGENLCIRRRFLRLFIATVVFVALIDIVDIRLVAVVRIVKIVDVEISHVQRFVWFAYFCLHAVVLQCHRNRDAVFLGLVASALNLFPVNTTRKRKKQFSITRLFLRFRYSLCAANAKTMSRSSNSVQTIYDNGDNNESVSLHDCRRICSHLNGSVELATKQDFKKLRKIVTQINRMKGKK